MGLQQEIVFDVYLYHALTRSNLSHVTVTCYSPINALRPNQGGSHLADEMVERIFCGSKLLFFDANSTKGVSSVQLRKNTALIRVLIWCRTGHKPLSEPIVA